MKAPGVQQIEAIDESRIFPRVSRSHTIWFFIGGGASLLVAAGGFFLALRSDASPLRLQLVTTLPAMSALALFGRGWQSRNGIHAVTLDAVGVTIALGHSTRHIPWTDIAWNSEGLQALSSTPCCTLYGNDGKILAKIPAVLDGFEEMIVLINRQVKSQPSAQAEHVRFARLRRQSLLVIGLAVVVLLVLSFLVWTEWDSRRRERLLATTGVDGVATIERKFTAPDGRTRRLEYRVNARRADGKPPDVVNAEMEPLIWEMTSEGATLPVKYAAADPDVSTLAFGERPEGPQLGTAEKILLFAGGGLLALFLLVAGILNRFGIDFVMDSETKRFRIARSVAK